MRTHVALVAVGILFLAGWGAHDIYTGERFIVVKDNKNLVEIGSDALGGFVTVRDINGKEVFRVQGGQVYMSNIVETDSGGDSLSPPDPRTDRIAQLIEVTPLAIDPLLYRRVQDMLAEADDLDAKASEMEQEGARLSDQDKDRPRWYWQWNPRGGYDKVTANDIDNKALRAKLRESALDLRSDAKKKRGEGRRLEREINTPRQQIVAWTGDRRIMLVTKRDLSRVLAGISRKGFFAWTGARGVAAGDGSIFPADSVETYEAQTIKPCEPPTEWAAEP